MRLVGLLLLFVVLPSGPAFSAGGNTNDPDPLPVASVDVGGGLEVRTRFNGVQVWVGGSGGPRCSWRRLSVGEYEDLLDIGVDVDPPVLPVVPVLPTDREPTPEEVGAQQDAQAAYDAEVARRAEVERRERVRRAGPTEIAWRQAGVVVPHGFFGVYCPGVGAQFVYVALDTDDGDLLMEVEDLMRGRVPLPVSEVSPSVEAGGIVNVGMWLAVEAPVVPLRLTAEAGPWWVTMSAVHTGTVFEMGTGDRVVCSGVGDRIVELGVLEESPVCGYTYRVASPVGGVFELGISTVWSLPWVSSSGAGVLSHTQTTTFGYDVDEIQTIGRG